MKTSPEYLLTRSLIDWLRAVPELEGAVYPEPFHKADQCQALALAAAQYDLAVAVQPLPPVSLAEKSKTVGAMQAQLGVAVFTTGQVADPEKQAAAAGRVLAAVLGWCPEGSAGIPYAAAEVLQVSPLNTADYPDLANLEGTAILIGKEVNYKQFYK